MLNNRTLSPCRVIAEATPGANIAEYARASVEEAMAVQGQCSSEDQFDLPPASFELFADSGFAVDWCQFQVLHMYRKTSKVHC